MIPRAGDLGDPSQTGRRRSHTGCEESEVRAWTLGRSSTSSSGFPDNKFNGEIAPELAKLIESRTVRILDLIFVAKDDVGDIVSFEFDQLDELVGFADLEGEVGGVLSDEDIAYVGAQLEPGSSAALLVWEDLWAAPFAAAVLNSGGILLEGGRDPARAGRRGAGRPRGGLRAGHGGITPGPEPTTRFRSQTEEDRDVATQAPHAGSSDDGSGGRDGHRGERRGPPATRRPRRPKGSSRRRAPPPEAEAPAEDPYEALTKLGQLHDQGILTDEEFAAEKAKILG